MIHTAPQATIWAAIRNLDPTLSVDLNKINFWEELLYRTPISWTI